MSKYTPAEIIAGGIRDTRESFVDLYVQLDELRKQAAYFYHLAFVDTGEEPDQGAELPFHPAPAGFGGNEVVRQPRRVNLDRLTDAGFTLYVHGVRTALRERDQLAGQIEIAEHDLERMVIAMSGTIDDVVTAGVRYVAAREHRGVERPPSILQPWDVPVRRPGTTDYLAPDNT